MNLVTLEQQLSFVLTKLDQVAEEDKQQITDLNTKLTSMSTGTIDTGEIDHVAKVYAYLGGEK